MVFNEEFAHLFVLAVGSLANKLIDFAQEIDDIDAADPVLTLIGMLNDDADERREYAANQLYKYAWMSEEKAEEICEIFCTHIRKNSNIYFNPNGDIIIPREFTKIVKWLFEKDGIFQNIIKISVVLFSLELNSAKILYVM